MGGAPARCKQLTHQPTTGHACCSAQVSLLKAAGAADAAAAIAATIAVLLLLLQLLWSQCTPVCLGAGMAPGQQQQLAHHAEYCRQQGLLLLLLPHLML